MLALIVGYLRRPAGRRCGYWPMSTFHIAGIVVCRIGGQPMELGVGADADVGFARSGGGEPPQQNERYLTQYASQELRKKLLIYPITPVSTVGTGMSA
jgi:hypothetical protein